MPLNMELTYQEVPHTTRLLIRTGHELHLNFVAFFVYFFLILYLMVKATLSICT
jgi:hypothetical protein